MEAQLTFEYIEDGAADSTIVALPAVKSLIPKSVDDVRFLIERLDDVTPTQCTARAGGHTVAVPRGYIYLDILAHSINPNTPVFRETGDDGWGSQILPEYYFRPDVLRSESPTSVMRSVKRNWLVLQREDRLRVAPENFREAPQRD